MALLCFPRKDASDSQRRDEAALRPQKLLRVSCELILKLADFDWENELSLVLSDAFAPIDNIVADVAAISDSVKESGGRGSVSHFHDLVILKQYKTIRIAKLPERTIMK